MKKIISLALLGATTSLMAMYAEHAYLYKDPRIMGMGGANVAVGGYSTSVFSNPAGLTNIKKEHGVVFDLLSLGVSGSEAFQTFADDLEGVETDENINPNATTDMINVIDSYSGQNFHIGVDNYMAISKNSDAFAWSLGILAAADINFMPHSNGSATGGILETSSRAYGGVIFGVAKPYQTALGTLDVGLSVKHISQQSYEGILGLSELMDDNDSIGDKLQDKYEKESSGTSFDIGITYKPFPTSFWKPAFGLSVLNIGGLPMDDNYGAQPMTVNVGASITPDVPFMNKLVLAVDLVDLTHQNTTRIYDYSADGTVVGFTDYEEDDLNKRLRLGIGMGLVDTKLFSLALNGGMYQGAYSAGVDMTLTLIKLNVATYQEQMGTGSVDIPDRRVMARIGIGW